jgi:hypothetical protein
MIETALFLPLFLLVLFGVIWAVQSSVMYERSEISVRFSGIISDEANPYEQYSLGALYDGLPGIAGAEVYACASPGPDALQNDPTDATFPGPKSPSFFRPLGGSSTVGTCTQGPAHLSGGSLTEPELFIHTQSSITPQISVPSFLQNFMSATQNLSASQNFFDGPDVQTLLACYDDGTTDDLGTVIEDSLTHASMDTVSAPTPLPDSPVTTPLSLSGTC